MGAWVVLEVGRLAGHLAERGTVVSLYECVTWCTFKMQEFEEWTDDIQQVRYITCEIWRSSGHVR